MGPGMLDGWMGGEVGLTCEDDELASVSVIESVLALARENMRDGESDVLGELARTPHHPSALVFNLLPEQWVQTCGLVQWAAAGFLPWPGDCNSTGSPRRSQLCSRV
jgi:hypothetical protein